MECPIAELISIEFLLFLWQSIIVCIQADLILVIALSPPRYWDYRDEHYMPNIF